MENKIISLISASIIAVSGFQTNGELVSPIVLNYEQVKKQKTLLSSVDMDLDSRNPNKTVNDIFRDNILLNLHSIKGDQKSVMKDDNSKLYGHNKIDWEKVWEPFEFELLIEPGQLFAFHDELLPEFENYRKKALTGWTKFSIPEGYKVLDGLSGNGVCHLATLLNFTASKAGLLVSAKVNHDFLPVPGIPKEYGTSIVYIPGALTTKMQNLYIVNEFDYPVVFKFKIDKDKIILEIYKV